MIRYACVWLLVLGALPAVAADKPNVILIVTDDQGYGDVGSHGNPVLKTPNTDRLRAEAVRFTDFHVAPMCSPTRGQLMTGVDAMRNGCTAVCQGRSMMRRDLPTMADIFARSGYATGHFGKWHLGDSYPHRPQDRGFAETLHHRAWGITSLADYWGNSYFDPVLNHNGVDRKFKGYCTDIFFAHAMEFVDRCARDRKPFFVYLPTNTPHAPNVCAEQYSNPYRGRHEGKPIPDTFYGMIANIDENLGKLEGFLKERGLRENTILIYMTDNGTQSAGAMQIFNAGMRDRKTSVFEGGHRVPCFVRWPAGDLKHGRDVDELTQVQDLLPTLIELCGLNSGDAKFDGLSLAPLLRGTADKLPDRKLVVQYRVSGEKWQPAVVMWHKWRLVGPGKLYNIATDPHQDTNVAEKHPDIARAMEAHYDAWHAAAKPLFDRPRWIIVGSDKANPMMLYAQDWTGGYCDNRGGLVRATATGYWNVIVDRDGVYELELRRWPVEANLPLAGGAEGGSRAGARPIAAANVRIAGGNYTLDSAKDATHVTFRIRLKAGKTQLATAFLDKNGRTLCSAIYVKLTRLPGDSDRKLTPPSTRTPSPSVKPAPSRPGPAAAPAKPVKLAADDILIADFEAASYGKWATTGTAFGSGPTGPKNRVANHQGKRLVDTFLVNESDKPTGTLTSPPFTIDRSRIHLLVGGGNHPGKTCVNLQVAGKTVRAATGPAAKDARKRKIMSWVVWDVNQWKGKTARIEIVDRHSGGWGHIMVDHIFQSNR